MTTKSKEDDDIVIELKIKIPAKHAQKMAQICAQAGTEAVLDPRGAKIISDFMGAMIPLVSKEVASAIHNPQNLTTVMEWVLAAQQMMLDSATKSGFPEHPVIKMNKALWASLGFKIP